MATLISRATGDFTAAATWALANSTAELDSEAASTAVGTGGTNSSAFTPGLVAVDAIAVKLAARAANPTGTFKVELWDDVLGAVIADTTVTVNVADLDANGLGWYVFLLPQGAVDLPVGAIRVRVTCSVASEVTLYRNSTADNWSRQLRTTTQQAPAATDKLIVAGEHTGQGTGNSFTVTMNNTATTTFGATSHPQSLSISKRATLSYGVAGSTAYLLKIKGIVAVYGGGTLSIGTSGAPIDAAGTTGVLQFDPTSNVDSGLRIEGGGIVNLYGKPKAAHTKLTADVAAAGTVLTVEETDGWEAGDVLAIASTTQTPGQCEHKTVSTVDSATQVTLTAGVTNAHSGTAPTQGEVLNLTRRARIGGASATLQGYILHRAAGVMNAQDGEFYWMGSATADKRGYDYRATTGSGTFTRCVWHDMIVTQSWGIRTTAGDNYANLTLTDCVFYNCEQGCLTLAVTTASTWTITNCVAMKTIGVFNVLTINDLGGTIDGLTAIGSPSGLSHGMTLQEFGVEATGSFNNLVAHSNSAVGIAIQASGGLFTNLTAWRNGTGHAFSAGIHCIGRGTVVEDVVSFGNANKGNLAPITTSASLGLVVRRAILNGDTTFASVGGVVVGQSTGSDVSSEVTFEDCDLGTASGIKTTHTAGDLDLAFAKMYVRWTFRNCKFSSTNLFSTAFWANTTKGSYVRSQKHNQVAGAHKTFYGHGTVEIEATTFKTAAPSEKLSPTAATSTWKLASGVKRVAVANGGAVTPSVWVRKDSSYNGNAPRLILKRNVAAGIAADVVLDTLSVGADTWEELTAATAAVTDDAILEFYVDCDGTAGSVFADDWSAV